MRNPIARTKRISSSTGALRTQNLPPKAVCPRVSWRSASRPRPAGDDGTDDPDDGTPSSVVEEAAQGEVEAAGEENRFLQEGGDVPCLAAPEQVQGGEEH